MFNIGTGEIIVIAVVALIFLGPEQFPTQAKVFLRMLREFREHWDDAKRDILNELNPVKKEFRDLGRYKPEDLLDKLTGEDQSAELPKEEVTASGEPASVDSGNADATTGPV